MRIVIIGTGNVAHIAGRAIVLAGHTIVQVYGRHAQEAKDLAELLKSTFTSELSHIDHSADLYIIAVSDHALQELASVLRLGKKVVVHTAGSVSKDVLRNVSVNYGVLYPLQSMRTEMNIVPEIPILIDANTADNLALLYDFSSTLSYHVQNATDEQRLKLHIAAVVVSNFSNHLYALAEEYCRKEGVEFRMLQPLITAIAQRVHDFSPRLVQTGPAVRHDQQTIEKHISLLQDYPALKELYEVFTRSIEEMYP